MSNIFEKTNCKIKIFDIYSELSFNKQYSKTKHIDLPEFWREKGGKMTHVKKTGMNITKNILFI